MKQAAKKHICPVWENKSETGGVVIAFLDRVKTKMKPVNLQKKPSPNADLCFVDIFGIIFPKESNIFYEF